jgi:hypothetical protein
MCHFTPAGVVAGGGAIEVTSGATLVVEEKTMLTLLLVLLRFFMFVLQLQHGHKKGKVEVTTTPITPTVKET